MDQTRARPQKAVISFDPATGRLGSDQAAHVSLIEAKLVLPKGEDEGPGQLLKCPACGHEPSNQDECAGKLYPGDDALAAVVCQRLLEALPAPTIDTAMPAAGRKLLVFSDNRQDAAFFAPFFERASYDQAIRRAVAEVVAEEGSAQLTPERLMKAVHAKLNHEYLSFRVFRKNRPSDLEYEDEPEAKTWLLGRLLFEFCVTRPSRETLESLGLVYVDYQPNALLRVAESLEPFLRTGNVDPVDLTRLLLDGIRRNRQILPYAKVDLTDEDVWSQAFNQKDRAISISLAQSREGATERWLPATDEHQQGPAAAKNGLIERRHTRWFVG